MSRKTSDWYVPPDWAFQFGLLVIIPTIVILAGTLLPVLSRLKTVDVFDLFWSGLGLGLLGTVLLFLRDYRFTASVVFGLWGRARCQGFIANFIGWPTRQFLSPFYY
jgi:hypothetical protein